MLNKLANGFLPDKSRPLKVHCRISGLFAKRAAIFLAWAVFLLPIAVLAAGDPNEILLWPNGAPGSEGKTNEEVVRIAQPTGDHVITSVNKPSIKAFLPAPDKATGAAVIVAPGGGHSELWMDHEGYNVAQWLSEHGVAAFVLKYRLAKATNSTYTVDGDELADMQRAIRLVRSRAGEWGINPNRLGVMGFSAGGELAFLSAMHFDNGKPDASDPVDRQSCCLLYTSPLLFDKRLIESEKDYAHQLLTHVNPYMKEAYVDEPGVAIVEIVNEEALYVGWSSTNAYDQELTDLYNAWLQKNLSAERLVHLRELAGVTNNEPIPRLKGAAVRNAPKERYYTCLLYTSRCV